MAFQTPFLFNDHKKGELSTYLLRVVFLVQNKYGLEFEIMKINFRPNINLNVDFKNEKIITIMILSPL